MKRTDKGGPKQRAAFSAPRTQGKERVMRLRIGTFNLNNLFSRWNVKGELAA
jgi:hypothetical protein